MDGPGAAGGLGGAGAQVVHAYDVIQDLQVAVSVGWSAGPGDALPSFLEVLEQEAEGRRHRRINRLGKESRLPSGRTWEILGHDRMPPALRQQLDQLDQGSFVDRGVNVLAFGPAGTGRTQALFESACWLVQALLAAKRDGDPPRPQPPHRCDSAEG